MTASLQRTPGFFLDTRLSGVGTSGCLAQFIYGRKSKLIIPSEQRRESRLPEIRHEYICTLRLHLGSGLAGFYLIIGFNCGAECF